jgi:hypothetical protein
MLAAASNILAFDQALYLYRIRISCLFTETSLGWESVQLVGPRAVVHATRDQILRAFFCQKLQKAFRADARPTGEQSFKMTLAQPDVRRHFFMAGLVFVMVFIAQDHLFDAQAIFGRSLLIGGVHSSPFGYTL